MYVSINGYTTMHIYTVHTYIHMYIHTEHIYMYVCVYVYMSEELCSLCCISILDQLCCFKASFKYLFINSVKS